MNFGSSFAFLDSPSYLRASFTKRGIPHLAATCAASSSVQVLSDNRLSLFRFQTFHSTRRTPSHPRTLLRFIATMDSSDSSLRLRVCEVSQVPVRTFDTQPPALPRPLHTSYVVRRRTILASSNRRDWPADRDLHEALTHGSLALELMSSSDKTPARQSPSARLIFLLTFRHLYEISSFQLTSSAKLVLAYPNLGSISIPPRQPHPYPGIPSARILDLIGNHWGQAPADPRV